MRALISTQYSAESVIRRLIAGFQDGSIVLDKKESHSQQGIYSFGWRPKRSHLAFRLAFKQTLTFTLLAIVVVWGAYALPMRWMLVLLPLIILAQTIVAWTIVGTSLKPLKDISTAAREISLFDLRSRLPVSARGDELDELSASLNTMIVNLQSSFQQTTEFLRSLSHEIRHPLTLLRAETEQALRTGSNETNNPEMLSKQLEHVELLARTISDLMDLAQSESEQVKLQPEQEDLSELVQAAIEGMRAQASERGIQISGTVQQNIIGCFDAGQIWRLLLNLLDNAIKFNRPGGHIDVTLAVYNNMAMISVSDTGGGILAEEQSHIFDRGYRTTAARRSSVPGTGLGLYFARAIAEAHGGTIEVTSVPGEGSGFRISLPLDATNETLSFPAHEVEYRPKSM
jgi:signal transduction histidine kinase